jgi:hypothetical protein
MCTREQFKVEGKRAFNPDKDPLALNPYPQSNYISAYDLWLEGWSQTAIKHEQEKHFLSYLHVQCNVLEAYVVQTFKETSCWQLAQKIDDFRFDGYVCQDCIVYKYAKPNDEFNKQQLEKILHKRKILKTEPITK